MTLDEILALPASRELDAEVAVRLGHVVEWRMEYEFSHQIEGYWTDNVSLDEWEQKGLAKHPYIYKPRRVLFIRDGDKYKHLPPYSTNNASACRLIEHITEQGGLYGNDIFIEWWNDDEWFICNQDLYTRRDGISGTYKVEGETSMTQPAIIIIVGRAPKLALAIARFFIGWEEKQRELWGETPR